MKLSWLKLHIDILDDQKIKIIRKMPAGSDLFVVWIGLLCLAMKGKDPGVIEIDDGIPYQIDDLANHLDLSTKTIQMALATFRRLRMIETDEGGTIEICNFRKHQSLDQIEYRRELNRVRVAKYRESLKIGHKKDDVTRTGVTGNAIDIEIDRDRELDIEKELKENRIKEKPATAASPSGEVLTSKELISQKVKQPTAADLYHFAHQQITGNKPTITIPIAVNLNRLHKQMGDVDFKKALQGFYASAKAKKDGFNIQFFISNPTPYMQSENNNKRLAEMTTKLLGDE